MSLPKDLQACVGELPMTRIATAPLQQGLPAQGFVAPPLERYLGRQESAYAIERPLEGGGPFELWEPSGSPGVVVVESDQEPILLRGHCSALKQGGLAVALTQPATLRLGEYVLNLRQDHAELWRLPAAPELPSAPWEPPARPSWPGVGALLLGMRCSPWLESRVGASARSGSPLASLIAVGELLRLWGPVTPEDRTRCVEQALQGRSPRVEAAREWARQQQGLGHLIELAILRTSQLREELLAALELPPDTLAQALPALLLERDKLASVMQVFLLLGEGQALGRALQELDEESSLHSTQLGELIYGLDGGDWGEAVRASDPDAWWVA